MLALNKTVLLMSAMLLVGAGVFAQWVAAPALAQQSAPRWRRGALIGAALLIIASPLDLWLTVQSALGFTTPELLWNYLRHTRHGGAVQLRLALTLITFIFVWRRPTTPLWKAATALASLGLLGTFSWISHAASMGGLEAIAIDLIHFLVGASWAGTILYLALAPLAQPEADRRALLASFDRTSRLGLSCVIILAVTGAFSALFHLEDPERFVRSAYGVSFFIKQGLVLMALAVAALNRFWLLPEFEQQGKVGRFHAALKLEALLIVGIFIATGILTVQPMPHELALLPPLSTVSS